MWTPSRGWDWRTVLADARAVSATVLWRHGRGLFWLLLLAGPLQMNWWSHLVALPCGLAAGLLTRDDGGRRPWWLPHWRLCALGAAALFFVPMDPDFGLGGESRRSFQIALCCAAACGAWPDEGGRRPAPRWLGIAAVAGLLLPVRWFVEGNWAAAMLVTTLGVVAALALAGGEVRRLASAWLVFGAVSCCAPRDVFFDPFSEWLHLDREIVHIWSEWVAGWGTVSWFWAPLSDAVVALVVWELVWPHVHPANRRASIDAASARLAVQTQHRPWEASLSVVLTMVAIWTLPVVWWGGGVNLSDRVLALTVLGSVSAALAFAYHATFTPRALFGQAAAYAAVPVAAAPLILLVATQRGGRDAWTATLLLILLLLWSVASGRLIVRSGVRRPIAAEGLALLLLVVAGCALPWHVAQKWVPLTWLALVPLAFHVVVRGESGTPSVLRGSLTLGTLAAAANSAVPQNVVDALPAIPLLVATWFGVGCLAAAARRHRSLSAIPPDHPILTDFRERTLAAADPKRD